jgi:hypothetical protein
MTDDRFGAPEDGYDVDEDGTTWAPLVDTLVAFSRSHDRLLMALVELRNYTTDGEAAARHAVMTIPSLTIVSATLTDWLRAAAEDGPGAVEQRPSIPGHDAMTVLFMGLWGEVPDYPVEWVSDTDE